MRRDMDLARAILLELEKCTYTGECHDISVDGYPPEEINYHIRLLCEAGLIEATDETTNLQSPYPEWKAIAITWDGHEFLDSARNDTRWERAKSVIRERGAALTLDALKFVLSDLINRALKGNLTS